MRSKEEYEAALELVDQGINDCEIGRRLGISRVTIRDWRTARAAGSGGRTLSWTGRHPGGTPDCFRCSGSPVVGEAYAYLLGLYLGDGYISAQERGVFRLRIFCDLRHPELANEIAASMVAVRGSDRVGFAVKSGCVAINTYWKHWPCLFPQHGPGRKHERLIELEPWQQTHVEAYPTELIRGLIHSDGCRHINEVARPLASGVKRYRYPRYIFTNASVDILRIFTDALDRLGVHWTRTSPRDISVARRPDVAFLETFVGPKR